MSHELSDDEFFRTLVANTSEGLLTIDEESTILFANPAIEDILGYHPDELVGSSKMTIIPDRLRETHQAGLEQYLETGERHISWNQMILPALHKDGHELPVSISLREHSYDGQRLFTGVFRDISEQQAREETLREQNEQLEHFGDVLSHDLRNPLNVAQAHTDVLREKYDDESLEEVAQSLERIESLIEDVLTLSRLGEAIGDREFVTFEQCVTDAWRSVETNEATLEVTTDSTHVHADRSRLRQLLENLFRNSVEHGGPDVTVRVGVLEDGSGFFVEDDGPGIPEESHEAIFEQGFTTAEGGTGFGLAIVQRIAEAHGWDVDVRTTAPTGVRFEFASVRLVGSE